MDWKLEVVVVPVTDTTGPSIFSNLDQVGFKLDADIQPA